MVDEQNGIKVKKQIKSGLFFVLSVVFVFGAMAIIAGVSIDINNKYKTAEQYCVDEAVNYLRQEIGEIENYAITCTENDYSGVASGGDIIYRIFLISIVLIDSDSVDGEYRIMCFITYNKNGMCGYNRLKPTAILDLDVEYLG